MARLVFLGRLEDLAGSAEIDVAPGTLGEVLQELPQALRDEVARGKVRFAVNGAVLATGADLNTLSLGDGDEIALLPPVSGG